MKFCYYTHLGETYRALRETEKGMWLICCASSSAPFFVLAADMKSFEHIETPEEYYEHLTMEELSDAQKKRYEMILPLIQDESCITNKRRRNETINRIAVEHNTTPKRIKHLYYQYLATGILVKKKKRKERRNEDFDYAIKRYYYSAKRFSLKTAYELMLMERFMEDGVLAADAPTWKSFEYYFYHHKYHKNPQAIITRKGLSHFQRNVKMLYSESKGWKKEIGSYQMDSTIADIYLVSRANREDVVGRPYIVLAVDTCTQLVAGVKVGLGSVNEDAVMSCLANAAMDKTVFCNKYGINITQDQWASVGVPKEIIIDNGREFKNKRMDDFCMRYGIEIHSLPPYRPDRKGVVEKTFDLIQQKYKPLLRGKGIIEEDANERWACDYRAQAILNLDEFTAVVILCILWLNNGRLLMNGETPSENWNKSENNLLVPDWKKLYRVTLPRTKTSVGRRGIKHAGAWYAPEHKIPLSAGDRCMIAYDNSDVSKVYIMVGDDFIPCHMVGDDASMELTVTERSISKTKQQKKRIEMEKKEVEISINTMTKIKALAEKASGERSETPKQISGSEIKKHGESERVD